MPDDIKPWTIRNVPPDVRQAAIAAAKRRGLDLGELVSRALLSDIQAERQDVFAPGEVTPEELRAPAALPTPAPPPLDLAGLAQLLGALGTMPEGTLRRDAERTTRAVLRQARGLPPVRLRRRTLAASPKREVAETPQAFAAELADLRSVEHGWSDSDDPWKELSRDRHGGEKV